MPRKPRSADVALIEKRLDSLGRMPTWSETNKIAREAKAHASTVFRRAKARFGSQGPATSPQDASHKQAGESARAPDTTGRLQAPGSPPGSTPAIRVRMKHVPEQAMPKFAVPSHVPTAKPNADGSPPVPPPGVPGIEWQAMVDVFCDIANARLSSLTEGEVEKAPPKPPAPISKEERQRLAQAWGPLLAKYAPFLAKYAVEVNALIVTIAILGPRLMEARAYNKYRRDIADIQQTRREAAPSDALPSAFTPAEPDEPDLKQMKNLGDDLARRIAFR